MESSNQVNQNFYAVSSQRRTQETPPFLASTASVALPVLGSGERVNIDTPLTLALKNRKINDVRTLIEGCDGNGKPLIDALDIFLEVKGPQTGVCMTMTPLALAAGLGFKEAICLMLEARYQGQPRVDVNAHNETHTSLTPLIMASFHGHTDIVQMLIDARADVNAGNQKGVSALMVAATIWGNDEMVRALLKAGADTDARDHNGRSALMLAAAGGHIARVQMLLTAGANKNDRDHEGRSALMYAAACRHPEIVMMLLAEGANEDARDAKGRLVLMYAAKRGSKEAMELLRATGAIPDASRMLVTATRADHVVNPLSNEVVPTLVAQTERSQELRSQEIEDAAQILLGMRHTEVAETFDRVHDEAPLKPAQKKARDVKKGAQQEPTAAAKKARR